MKTMSPNQKPPASAAIPIALRYTTAPTRAETHLPRSETD